MKYKALITAPYFQLVVDKYKKIFEEHGIEMIVTPVNERMSEEELLPLMKDADAILCGDDRITERVLEAAPKLKTIVKWGTGIDSIDKEAAARRGISVRNTPNAFTDPVADTIMSFILCFARGTIDLDRKIREGVWEKKLNKALNECVLGIVGVGNIGRAVIKRGESFGIKIVANDIEERPYEFMTSLEEVLKQSDFVVLSADLNPTSYHLINESNIGLMKREGYLINASRGPLIEEGSLIKFLKAGRIAGAGLDVFEHEPLPDSHPLKRMPNVILSPHNANASFKAWQRVHENSVNSLIEELEKHNA